MHEEQAKDDFFLVSELVRDYIGIVGSVREAFNERSKAWQVELAYKQTNIHKNLFKSPLPRHGKGCRET